MPEDKPNNLTLAVPAVDQARNIAQALIKGVPYAGPVLDQIIFGPIHERRFQRLENTLTEVVHALGADGFSKLQKENFVNLIEKVAPDLARAENELKRQRLRNLLVNAARVTDDEAEWAKAMMAHEFLKELDDPAFDVLAAISKCKKPFSDVLFIVIEPGPQVYEGEYDFKTPPKHVHHQLSFEAVVLDYWVQELKTRQLIWYKSSDGRGSYGGVGMTPRGEFLVNWVLSFKISSS